MMCIKHYHNPVCVVLQGDIEKGLEMKKLVLSGFLASEEIYINQLEALLLVRVNTQRCNAQEATGLLQSCLCIKSGACVNCQNY